MHKVRTLFLFLRPVLFTLLQTFFINDPVIAAEFDNGNMDKKNWGSYDVLVFDDGDPSMIIWTSIPSPKLANNNVINTKQENQNVPDNYELDQNYPNPFNPSTTIRYALPLDSHVTVNVYDILGRKIETLVDRFENAGYYLINFDGSRLSSGIYFYKLSSNNYTCVKKMFIVK